MKGEERIFFFLCGFYTNYKFQSFFPYKVSDRLYLYVTCLSDMKKDYFCSRCEERLRFFYMCAFMLVTCFILSFHKLLGHVESSGTESINVERTESWSIKWACVNSGCLFVIFQVGPSTGELRAVKKRFIK